VLSEPVRGIKMSAIDTLAEIGGFKEKKGPIMSALRSQVYHTTH
jgi:hypothetical protein